MLTNKINFLCNLFYYRNDKEIALVYYRHGYAPKHYLSEVYKFLLRIIGN